MSKCSYIFLVAGRTLSPRGASRRRRWLHPAEVIDLLKGFIIAVCVYAMVHVDTSVIYHVIKSQSVIKLYLFYNMLEVRTTKLLRQDVSLQLIGRVAQ